MNLSNTRWMVPVPREHACGAEGLWRSQVAVCTVQGMNGSDYLVPDGRYSLHAELTADQRDLLNSRMEHFARLEAEGVAEEWEDDPEELFEMFSYDVSTEAPCWWFAEGACEGELNCHCGPVTLLEVLTRLEPDRRKEALSDHMIMMGELWSHHWSGQGLLDGGTASIGDACAECIINGANHVFDVRDAASSLAEELGEALAAYSCEIELGKPRWNPELA